MVMKTFEGKLVLNLKTGEFRAVKRAPHTTSHNELVVNFKIDVDEPDPQEVNMDAKVKISRKQFNAVVLDSL